MPPFPPPRNSMAFSNQPGPVGAIARFWARTYAADYVALGVVATGFILVSHSYEKENIGSDVGRFNCLSRRFIECSIWIIWLFSFRLRSRNECLCVRLISPIFISSLTDGYSMVHRLLRRLSRARSPPLGHHNPSVRTQTPRQLSRASSFSNDYTIFDGYNQKRRWSSTTGSY